MDSDAIVRLTCWDQAFAYSIQLTTLSHDNQKDLASV